MSKTNRKLIIDTDAGIDDAQAILMALRSPDVELVAITTCHGNTDEYHVCRNVLRLLKVAGHLEIPVYRGSHSPLVGPRVKASHYHGIDGFGDVADPDAPDVDLARSEHAVLAIIRLVKEFPNEITLVQLAPSTNLALALRLYPDLSSKLKACFIMGGNYEGRGNITPCAEFNFHADPEAASVVLNELRCPLHLVCWELCLKHKMTWSWYETFVNKPTAAARFIKTIERKTIERYYKDSDCYVTADQLLMACVLDYDGIVRATSTEQCSVERGGVYSRGLMVILGKFPLGGVQEDHPRVNLILDVDFQAYADMLQKATD